LKADYYIAGDWGTSSLRLYLVNTNNGKVVDSLKGDGISKIDNTTIESQLTDLISKWEKQYDTTVATVILSGMVGSTIGWHDAGYCNCPLALGDIAKQLYQTKIDHRTVYIIPGLQCINQLGQLDVMRGEETQLLGAMHLQTTDRTDNKYLFCLPGTHSKWVEVVGDKVQAFTTSLSGELFATLAEHSILVSQQQQSEPFSKHCFIMGVAFACKHSATDLLYLLFQTRVQTLFNESLHSPHSYLSGMIIGRELTTAIALFDIHKKQTLCFISNAVLNQRYQFAAKSLGYNCLVVDGNLASCSGIHLIYQFLCNQ